jgi:hypothetical protein
MKTHKCLCFSTLAGLLTFCVPAFATVAIASFTPSHKSPQPIGKTITWTATATDTGAGPLTFQFNMTGPKATQAVLVKDFNVGTLSAGVWTSQPFVWIPTGVEGAYHIQVVIKDFGSGETTSKTDTFVVDPVVTGSSPVIVRTANPLVILFSAPSCAAGSSMRAVFQEKSASPPPPTATNWTGCHPTASMTLEIAGMLPSTPYSIYAETRTGSKTANGPTVNFTSEALSDTIPFPTFTVSQPKSGPPSDSTNLVLLHNMIEFGTAPPLPDVATDLAGNIIWYYYPDDLTNGSILTRPLQGGGMLTLQDDVSWDPTVTKEQLMRQIDLAGNIVRETNMGIIQQQLKALGAIDGGSCRAIPTPAPVGSGCVGALHHDAIQTLPNGWTAALLDLEKIFPAGTQGDKSGLPVDVIGDMIIVLDTNWQVRWYWDVFDPGGGGNGYAKLPVSRTAVLGETCGSNTSGCPPVFLLGAGIAPLAHDWLHANTLYYWPNSGGPNNHSGDIVWSSRHQDWVMKIDYRDGAGTGDTIWRMGPSGDFAFENAYNDPWPWFSHQHDAGIENGGSGPMTIFDNGNTRVSQPATSTGGVPGLGSACKPNDCDSRGMAVSFDESTMTVSVSPNGVSFDLGAYSNAMGSAQLLANGNYFFENPIVVVNLNTTTGDSMEIAPTPAAPQIGPANVLLEVVGPEHYRGWQMPNLYFPPTT